MNRLTANIGRPDMPKFHRAVASATTLGDLEKVVQTAVGSSNFQRETVERAVFKSASNTSATGTESPSPFA